MLEYVPLDGEPYPGAKEAVAWHDLPELEHIWCFLRQNNVSGEETVKLLKQTADVTLEEHHVLEMAVIRPQMDTGDFKRYVAAKLGCF